MLGQLCVASSRIVMREISNTLLPTNKRSGYNESRLNHHAEQSSNQGDQIFLARGKTE